VSVPPSHGPLAGVRVIEIGGIGPGPFAGMLLSDLGAEVIRVDRPGGAGSRSAKYALGRGRRSIAIDLKAPDGLDTLMRLVERADLLFEGFRPGVTEKLGFGPDACLERNPRLVYGRMTGWGQTGPMAKMAGHDLNYLGLTGALTFFQHRDERPAVPPGFAADFGGGGLMLTLGLVAGLVQSRATGKGQVIDAAMVDGVASLTTLVYSLLAEGRWTDDPGTNFCDGGAPYYNTYATADDRYLAVAPIEPGFYDGMVDLLGLDRDDLPDRDDPENWPALKERFAAIFRSRTLAEWTTLFDGTDACVTPVLSFSEAPEHPHLAARATFSNDFGVVQPAPAPRFSATPGAIAGPPPVAGDHSADILSRWGFAADEVAELVESGVVLQA